jgi:hypothetical protein
MKWGPCSGGALVQGSLNAHHRKPQPTTQSSDIKPVQSETANALSYNHKPYCDNEGNKRGSLPT